MVREQKYENLDAWLDEARDSGITTLQTFAEGLKQDGEAVRAALETPYSNGQTEGAGQSAENAQTADVWAS